METGTIIAISIVAGCCGLMFLYRYVNQKLLGAKIKKYWAKKNNLTIIKITSCFFDTGPFFTDYGNLKTIFHVEVKDEKGEICWCWIRVGMGKLEVKWED